MFVSAERWMQHPRRTLGGYEETGVSATGYRPIGRVWQSVATALWAVLPSMMFAAT